MNSIEKILVIGATGHVGTPLVKQLLERNIPLRVFVRDLNDTEPLDSRVERVVGDLDKPETLVKAVEGIESIFLVTFETHQDQNVITAALKAGCRKIVKLSTQEAGWTPIKGHGHWHHEREELIKASGLAWTFLRPTMMMTVTLTWRNSIINKGSVVFPGGEGKLPAIHPADIAAVAVEALIKKEHDGKGYELTGPESLSMGEMTSILSRVLDKPLHYIEESETDFIADMLKMNLPKYTAEGLAETFRYVKAGDFAHRTDFVEQITGRKPATFERWCKENIEVFR